MTEQQFDLLKKTDKIHYVRIMPALGYYEIVDLVIVYAGVDHCSGTEKKTKQMFLLSKENALKFLFFDRNDALNALKEFKKLNKNTKVIKESEDFSSEQDSDI